MPKGRVQPLYIFSYIFALCLSLSLRCYYLHRRLARTVVTNLASAHSAKNKDRAFDIRRRQSRKATWGRHLTPLQRTTSQG